VGRLTRDPEVRYTPKGAAVARLDLAVNRRYKDGMGEWREEASFVPITVWREAAERCREKLKKGSPVYVEGRLRSTSWETKDGQKRSGLEVEAYRLQFLAKMGADESEGGGESAGGESEPAPAQAAVGGSSSEDEIPF
jgi:single-strand DNA-binding protein